MIRTCITLGATILLCLADIAEAERGSDGQVDVFYWQAPSILNPYLSGGVKDIEASSLILEPLARYDETGMLVPWLVDEIPTTQNGGVAADLMSITWRLRDGLTWSDGSPVTSRDIRFTWQYCTAENGGCAQIENFGGIAEIETPDDLTAVIRFNAPKPFPYTAFVGATSPLLQEAQFAKCTGSRAPTCTEENFAPIGTGPFLLEQFRANDVAVFSANPSYRDPSKPAFQRVVFKGGGNAEIAARAVLESGEFDYGWNLQLDPNVLSEMESAGNGTVVSGFGTLVERLVFNLTDPSASLEENRSTLANPHPILTDPSVREALSLAINRRALVDIGYGVAGRITCNIVPAPLIYSSSANDDCKTQDVPKARELLETSGWIMGPDGVRMKDGRRLSLLFQSSTNTVRQSFQAIIKQWWSDIGVETEIRDIDASVFFGSDPGSPDTYQKFFADVQMYANRFDGTDPEAYLAYWRCDRIPSPENQWQGTNMPRFCDPSYDRMVDTLRQTGPLEERAEIAKSLNDMLVQRFIMAPLVDRGRVSAHANSLGGVVLNTWDSEFWNIADWHRNSTE